MSVGKSFYNNLFILIFFNEINGCNSYVAIVINASSFFSQEQMGRKLVIFGLLPRF